MKTKNQKLWRACGQYITASDERCTDLKRHPYTMEEFEKMKTKKAVCDCRSCPRHGHPEPDTTSTKQKHTPEHRSTENGCEEGCEACTQSLQHTPGPWKSIAWGQAISISNGDIDGIAFINPHGNFDGGIPRAKDRANARLIAAAPELLEALKKTYAWVVGKDTRRTSGDIADILSDAIAKAEGK